ncbi:MAG: rhodanese-like domain-containing protein [Gammaproteobacteria bacterium]|nr:rhodanese-like domain-containing protein [Gammaproteobacteria bacterium]
MQDRESYNSLVKKALANGVRELMPWDLEELLETDAEPLLLDIREPGEFNAMHIPGSLNVPRGVLEAACDYDFDETEPDLVKAREREIIVICRSGNRSVLAAETLTLLGYKDVKSLKTGVRGWNDYEQPLVDGEGQSVSTEDGDEYFTTRLRPEQKTPA